MRHTPRQASSLRPRYARYSAPHVSRLAQDIWISAGLVAVVRAARVLPELGQPALLFIGRRHAGEEIGPALDGPAEGLPTPPRRDPLVVARQEYLGHAVVAKLGGPGVLWIVEPAPGEGVP